MKNLKDKVAVVTGAGSGIGRALAMELHREGARLALADIDRDGLDQTYQLLRSTEAQPVANLYELDVADRAGVSAFAEAVRNDFGAVDLLINNAGVSSSGLVRELTYETLEWTININLWGVIYVTKAFLPLLDARPEAGIVNISSVYGLLGIPGQAAYCASKFAVRGFTEALRQEYHGGRIAITVVFPGGIRTNIARNSRTDHPLDPETIEKGIRRMESSFKTSASAAARAIVDGIKTKATRVLIGKDARKIDYLARFNPGNYDRIVAGFIRKKTAGT